MRGTGERKSRAAASQAGGHVCSSVGSDHNEREHPGGEESQWKKIIVIAATVMDRHNRGALISDTSGRFLALLET